MADISATERRIAELKAEAHELTVEEVARLRQRRLPRFLGGAAVALLEEEMDNG